MSATGRWARRRPIAATVSRLEGSAHCRSSRPITSGLSSASSSARSVRASRARNRRPESLLTVIGPRSPAPCADSSAAMAVRRGSSDDRSHPSALAITPNGRDPSSSSAWARATAQPRLRARSSASASKRVLPMPASPSSIRIARWPEAARSIARSSSLTSASRPYRPWADAVAAMARCYRSGWCRDRRQPVSLRPVPRTATSANWRTCTSRAAARSPYRKKSPLPPLPRWGRPASHATCWAAAALSGLTL
jgi:hypothetical protein